ncbi:hypothetical protein MVEN_01122000 [Mycena venus]|uniref:Uncharacterized protein n=1 Tax=Mycena venus TaxID=2733690 RepID=A0A8H6YA47_9AGAR|nr:hypothetical protein MVEN_01122000 [Mycena venus]
MSPIPSLRGKRLDHELAKPVLAVAGQARLLSNIRESPEPTAIEPYFGLEARLLNIESEIAHLRVALKIPTSTPCPTSQRAQHERSMADKCVGGDLPIGTLNPPLGTPSSFHDAVQEEVKAQLDSLHKALDEFEQHAGSKTGRKQLWCARNHIIFKFDRATGSVQIRPFRCIYLHYTSLEDWTDQCDVLRCNPSF